MAKGGPLLAPSRDQENTFCGQACVSPSRTRIFGPNVFQSRETKKYLVRRFRMSIWLLRSALIQPKKGFQEFEDHNAFKSHFRSHVELSCVFTRFRCVFRRCYRDSLPITCRAHRSHVERFVDSVQMSDRMPVHEALQSV